MLHARKINNVNILHPEPNGNQALHRHHPILRNVSRVSNQNHVQAIHHPAVPTVLAQVGIHRVALHVPQDHPQDPPQVLHPVLRPQVREKEDNSFHF